MYSSPYDVLIPWCQLPEHANQSDDERLVALQAKTVLRLKTTFGSYRTLCDILTGEEYTTIKAALITFAGVDPRVADMEQMLRIPGNERGEGGGVDFAATGVRSVIQAMQTATLVTAEVAAKVLAIGEEYVSQIEAWGVTVAMGNLTSARQLIEEAQ